MTGIHHTAPTTYLRATRQEIDTAFRPARRPGRLLQVVRRFTGRTPVAGLSRWVDVTPASAAR
jgi:hypothetical protein